MIRYLLVLGAASALAMAQSAAAPASIDTGRTQTEKCSIEGRVLRSDDGTPLKKAIVTAMPQQSKPPVRPTSVVSDADGKFLFQDLEPGRYSLAAARTGYARQMYGQRSPTGPPTTLTLLAGQRMKDIVFRLLAGGAVSGRVVDEDSEPVSGVRIQALRWGYRNGKRELISGGGFAQSDDRGDYRMFQLAPGRYVIIASYSGSMYMGGGVTMSYGAGDVANDAYPPVYYPGVNDPAQASALEVRAGDDLTGINFRLLPTHAVRVTGRVLKYTGEAARDVFVQIMPRQATGFISSNRGTMPDAHGTFEFRAVAPGSYVVWAQQQEDGKRYQARTVVEVGNSDVDGVALMLRPPVDVLGRVRLDGSLDLSSSTVRVILMPQDFIPIGGGVSATLNSELGFTLANVGEGDYMLRVYGLPPDAYVSSAFMGKRDVLRDGVSLRASAEPLQIVVSASGARLEGSVLGENNQPFAGARVVLVPEEAQWKRQDLFKITSSDQYGQFLLRGIAPGKYKLFAWETIDEGAYYDPDFLRPVLDQGQSLEFSSGASLQAQTKLIHSGRGSE